MKILPAAIVLLTLNFSTLSIALGEPSGWVIGWGYNVNGQATGVPNSGLYATGLVEVAGSVLSNAVAVAADSWQNLTLKNDGTVVAWGYNRNLPGDLGGLSNVVAIVSSRNLIGILKNDGTAFVTRNSDGAIIELTNVMAIAGGWGDILAVQSNGIAGGTIFGLSNIVAAAIQKHDYGNRIALKNDGTVLEESTAGRSTFYAPVAGLSNVVAIAAGQSGYVALKKDGTVVGWGYAKAVPAGISNVVAISEAEHNGLALKRDGTVVAWGNIGFQPASVPEGLSNVVAIAAGDNYCLAITTNRAVAEKFRH